MSRAPLISAFCRWRNESSKRLTSCPKGSCCPASGDWNVAEVLAWSWCFQHLVFCYHVMVSVLASLQPVRGTMEANISSFSNTRAVESVYAANLHKWKYLALYKKHHGTLEGPHSPSEDLDFPHFFSCVSAVWCSVMFLVGLNSTLLPRVVCWAGCLSLRFWFFIYEMGGMTVPDFFLLYTVPNTESI